MRRAPGQQAFFIVVDLKSHMASMPRRAFVRVTPFPGAPYAKEAARTSGRSVLRGYQGTNRRAADVHLRSAVDHGAQWISDYEAQEAIQAAGRRLKCAGTPPHSVSQIYGWGEE